MTKANLPVLFSMQQRFARLTSNAKAICLASVIHELTMLVRLTYEVGTDHIQDHAACRMINELQHRLASGLHAYLVGEEERFPSNAIMELLIPGQNDEISDMSRRIALATQRCLEEAERR